MQTRFLMWFSKLTSTPQVLTVLEYCTLLLIQVKYTMPFDKFTLRNYTTWSFFSWWQYITNARSLSKLTNEKKAQEHPPREKKHGKERRSAIKTEATGFTYSEALLYIYIYNSFSLLVMNSEAAQEYNSPVCLLESSFLLKSEFRESELFFDVW